MLVLGKGLTGNSLHEYLNRHRIDHDYLDLNEVTHYNYSLVIKSPSIRMKQLKEFVKRGIKIISDVEFMYERYKRKIIGVTGTNGKSTTTTLVEKLTGYKSCGNIGIPVMDVVEGKDSLVIELSSFMLENIISFKPKIAIITNLGSAHTDSYDSIIEYHDSKLKILKNMTENDYLIYNYDDEALRDLVKDYNVKKIPVSLYKKFDFRFKSNKFYYKRRMIAKYKKINLMGIHNAYNVLYSIACAKVLKIKNDEIRKKLYSYKPLPYRLQLVSKKIYNDSKSTNVKSTIEALKCFKSVNLICGGYERNDKYEELIPYLKKVKLALCYGESSNRIEEFMRQNKIQVMSFKTLKDVISYLSQIKIKNTVLFSPFHSSHDQFKDFNERGREFNKLIREYNIIK